VTLARGRARRRFGQTIIANFVGCALLLIGAFTTPILVGLGFVILIISLGVRLYVLATARRASRRATVDQQ
jgi:uncharacterized membrane protein YphA (DoxX/SURF4 family)